MELLTRDRRGAWTHWRHAVLGLDALGAVDPGVDLAIVTERDPTRAVEAAAVIRLLRRFSRMPLRVVAACAHPTAAWRDAVLSAGADQAVLPEEAGAGGATTGEPLAEALELGSSLCPSLEVRCDQGVAMSVCGQRHCRWVLARHHLARWCVVRPGACPAHQEASLG
jgi:hypothetical protein